MKIKFPVLVICLCIMYSCQKEISVENGNSLTPNPTPTNDSTLISKIIGLDTTKVAPFDTTYKYLVFYDNARRVNTSYLVDYYNTGAILDTFWAQKHYYNGTDTLPVKITSIIHDYSNFFDTAYYTYSSPVRNLIIDSSNDRDINPLYPDLESLVYNYNYYPNKIFTTEKRYTNKVLQSQDSYWVYITRQNGNIISQIDTIPLLNASSFMRETVNATYDTKPNPLKFFIVPTPYFFHDNTYLLNPSANNITELNFMQQINLGSTSIEHYKYTYRYNAKGYPVEASVLNIGSTFPARLNKLKYYYTN